MIKIHQKQKSAILTIRHKHLSGIANHYKYIQKNKTRVSNSNTGHVLVDNFLSIEANEVVSYYLDYLTRSEFDSFKLHTILQSQINILLHDKLDSINLLRHCS